MEKKEKTPFLRGINIRSGVRRDQYGFELSSLPATAMYASEPTAKDSKPEEMSSEVDCTIGTPAGYIWKFEKTAEEEEPSSIDANGWRQKALTFLTESTHNVFVLEVYTVKDTLLQVKVSTAGVACSTTSSYFINTCPWSMVDGKNFPKRKFEETLRKTDQEARSILQQCRSVFSPVDLVRFFLYNCNGVPAIVSSNYANLLGQWKNEKRFMEYFVYQYIVPGSQRCKYDGCERHACAIKLNYCRELHRIYCAKHIAEIGIDGKVMLYNPLLVALTAHRESVVLSAFNLGVVYGVRDGTRSAVPEKLPRHWAPLSKMTLPKRLASTKPIKMLFEAAASLLDCADYHLRREKYHNLGVVVRHSLTVCLLEAYLKKAPKLCRLEFVLDEDFPYSWRDSNK